MERILAIVDRLTSRKLWLTVGVAVATAIWPDLDNEQKGQIIAGIGAVYVLVQGIVDALQGSKPTK